MTGGAPSDPVIRAAADALAEVLVGASVEVSHSPVGTAPPAPPAQVGVAVATGDGPADWQTTVVVRLNDRVARLVRPGERTSLSELLEALPGAALKAAALFRNEDGAGQSPLAPAVRRALRDTVAVEILAGQLASRVGGPTRRALVAETIEFLIELSGSRVEAHDVTHGVIVADVLRHTPRLELRYPKDLRPAKRAPLLFDGQRSVLIVDPQGRARTELQAHHFERLGPGVEPAAAGRETKIDTGWLVGEGTLRLGGIGFFVRADRSIWTFVDGQPLLVRRAEHWTAFPVELSASIANMVGVGPVAALVARAALIISAQPRGAILAIVDEPARLDGVVSLKDRYDLRNDIDPAAMRSETRLHHLIDAGKLDEHTLSRLATLDGATVVDLAGRLLAYGAIVTTTDSQHEGARTAAAKTLSETALVVLKVSVDGDITIFRDGSVVTTLLGNRAEGASRTPFISQ